MLTNLSEIITNKLGGREEVVVATIVSRQGSTPRTAGTKMAVFKDGSCHGTIGGGLFESRVIERSGRVLAEGKAAFMSFDLTGKELTTMDMVCGGRLEVFLDLLRPDDPTIAAFEAWQAEIAAGRPGMLVTAVILDGTFPTGVRHGLFDAEGKMTGDLDIGTLDIRGDIVNEALREARESPYLTVKALKDITLLFEPIPKKKTAYMIGAGHVSRPTAHLAALTGFRVVVLDDRTEFACRERFPDAAEVRVVEDYDHVLQDFQVDEDSFIIIVTRGHLHDREALAEALKTRAGYIGMIGSRSKRNAIYQTLMEEGFTNEDIERVHSPIGLSIGAQTPEEIAVSIVAEMIQVRAGMEEG